MSTKRARPRLYAIDLTAWSPDAPIRPRLVLESPKPWDEAADLPEFIAGGRQWDDFLIDDEAGVAYVTTHRENTIDRVRLSYDGNRDGNTVVAGDPFTDMLVGPPAGRAARRAITAASPMSSTTAAPRSRSMACIEPKVLRVALPPVI
jgi:hypothetical protein